MASKKNSETAVDSFAMETIDALPVDANGAIGVFDSGSGGMVTSAFVARMVEEAGIPAASVFFGDTKNLPYGERTQENVAELSDAIIRSLAPTCPVIGIACNTASASWGHFGVAGKGEDGPKVFSVVDVAAREAYDRASIVLDPADKKRVKVIGVLGTVLSASIQSHAEAIVKLYRDELSRAIGYQLPLIPYAFGPSGAAPTLVPGVIDCAHTPHVFVLREDEHGPGGTTRAGIKNWTPPQEFAEGVSIVSRDAQKLVAAVDVAHVLDANGLVKAEFATRVRAYIREHTAILHERRTTAVILGCTHFEYLQAEFARQLPTMDARGGIVSPSGALAWKILDTFEDQRLMQGLQPAQPARGVFFGFSGEVPPESMFRSLNLERVTVVKELAGASRI